MSTDPGKSFPLGKTGGLIEAGTKGWERAHPSRPRFRWVKPAASLKRVRANRGTVAVRQGFPLGKTGGLIEARNGSAVLPCRHAWFPLGKTGGLIEAYYAHMGIA